MKRIKPGAMLALLTAFYLHSAAQPTPPINEPNYNKPKVFADLPEKQPIQISTVESLLNLPVGAKVNTTIANGLLLNGTVISRSNPADATVKSVVIKSTNRQQATFTFSRILKHDGSISYIGRMISKDAGDALEITREGNSYIIRKMGYYDMINE